MEILKSRFACNVKAKRENSSNFGAFPEYVNFKDRIIPSKYFQPIVRNANAKLMQTGNIVINRSVHFMLIQFFKYMHAIVQNSVKAW